MADIFTNPVQVLSNTPGAGDWKIPIKITGLNTDESFIEFEVLIDGATEGGSLQTCFKADGKSAVRYPLYVSGLLAGQEVVVMAQSLNPADNVADPGGATVSASIQRASVNVLAMDSSVIVAIEAVLADDAIGAELKQAVIDKLIENLPDLDDLSVAAIRDAILNRQLAGNHEAAGTVGKLLQYLDAAVSSRLAATGYTSPDNDGIADAKAAAEAANGTLQEGGELHNALDQVATDVAGLNGEPMRGTENALLSASFIVPPTAGDNAAALLDYENGIEVGVTPKQALQRIGAVVTGKVSGAGTGTEVFVGMDGVTERVRFTAPASGNRPAVTYDA